MRVRPKRSTFHSFVSCHAGSFSIFFSFFFHCRLRIREFQCLKHRNKLVYQIVMAEFFLLQRCDLRDICAVHLSIVLPLIRRHRQYKHVLSRFSQYRSKFIHRCLLVFCKALLLASEFLTSYERFFMMSLKSSSSGSMKKIPRNFLALSSFGFSTVPLFFLFTF